MSDPAGRAQITSKGTSAALCLCFVNINTLTNTSLSSECYSLEKYNVWSLLWRSGSGSMSNVIYVIKTTFASPLYVP